MRTVILAVIASLSGPTAPWAWSADRCGGLTVVEADRACLEARVECCVSAARSYLMPIEPCGKGDPARAASLLDRGCSELDAEACSMLAGYAGKYAGFPSAAAAGELFRKAASLFGTDCDAGSAAACSALGAQYADGLGTAADSAKAARLGAQAIALREKSCGEGSWPDCEDLAYMHLQGQWTARDPAKARAIFERECRRDVWDACVDAGILVQGRDASRPDVAEAAELFERACAGDSVDGCTHAARMHERLAGPGWVQRVAEARDRACRLGNGWACHSLADWYQQGPLRPDAARSRELHVRGCELGAAGKTCEKLGDCPPSAP